MCIYNVSTEAKEGVLKKEKHQIVVDNKLVTVFLENAENPVENARPRTSSLPHSQERVRSGEKQQNEEHIPDVMDSCLQKVRFERRRGAMFLHLPLHSPYFSLLIQPPLADDLLRDRPSFEHCDTEVATIDKVPAGWGGT